MRNPTNPFQPPMNLEETTDLNRKRKLHYETTTQPTKTTPPPIEHIQMSLAEQQIPGQYPICPAYYAFPTAPSLYLPPTGFQAQYSQPFFQPQAPYTASRTVYLGGVPKDATAADVLHYVKGGLIERFRLFPDKGCAFIDFVDAVGAAIFYNRYALQRFSINGTDVRLGWAKAMPLSVEIFQAIQAGATRTIFLGAMDESYNEYLLQTEFSVFGPLESVRLVHEKKIAFIQFLNISHAIKALQEFGKQERWISKRIAFGKDHCVDSTGGSANYETQNLSIIADHTKALFEANESDNRTVYLGNLPENMRVDEICGVIKTGALQSVRYLKEKNCAFVTFLESAAAQAFYQHAAFTGIFLSGCKIRPGWGRSSAIPGSLANALRKGATRNIYIGGLSEGVSEEDLRRDFAKFGEIEHINILRDRHIAFVNFCSIDSAIKALEAIRKDDQYASLKLSFGKDRCLAAVAKTPRAQ